MPTQKIMQDTSALLAEARQASRWARRTAFIAAVGLLASVGALVVAILALCQN